MITSPSQTCVPKHSAIAAYLPGAYFLHDSWAITAGDPSLSALGQFIRALLATPPWVNNLMSIRNKAVSVFGLKNLGTLSQLDQAKPTTKYKPGDRVGIFTLIANTDDEVLLCDKDKHLNVMMSVHKAVEDENSKRVLVTVTTVVHVHNRLGRLYMLPVTPMHRVIAPTVLKTVGRATNAT